MIKFIGLKPPPKCPYCDNGRIYHSQNVWFDCTSCNGTGIEGNPGCLLFVFLGCILFWVGVGYLIWKG